uniref:ABC transporter domain-containing protein n=2 Tax=Ascaris TaxID=6251 RepID=A0A9J2PFE9_ASCLU
MTISAYLTSTLPTLPEEVKDYVVAILRENADEITSKDDVIEAVGEHIQSSVEGLSDEAMHNVCEKLMLLLHGGKEVKRSDIETGQRRLQQTVDISTQGIDSDAIESIWRVTTRDTPTMVDKKKLEKAEAKALEKCAKREILESGMNKKKRPADLTATASQAANRRDARVDASGGNTMDIHLASVDVSIGTKQLLCGADVTLVYGRRYGLVGRNGAGKSTFLKMISSKQLVIPSNLTMLSVEQEVDGDETEVVQAVLESDSRRTDMLAREKQLHEIVNRPGLSDEEKEKYSSELTTLYAEMEAAQVDKAPARAASILFGLGFTPEEQRRPTKEFSGGWRMRVALARALFVKPDLLLLDEPTNMLDMRAIFWLENHLQEWTTTIVIVSHDRSFLNAICTDIIHLHSRRLDQYRGNYSNFEKAMREKLTQQQREYEAQQQLRQHTQEFIDKFRYNAKRASMVQSRIKMLERLPALKPVEVEPDVVLNFPECEVLSNPVLQLDEASFKYTPHSPLIFQNLCIGSHANSRICIVGENGAGKTTLLKILMGDLTPTSGFRNANRRLRIGYFAQHHVDQLDMDVAGVELLASRFPGRTQEEYRAALGRFGLSGDLALQSVATLSGGQKSRVAFASLAMQNPNYLIMDEPTNHLDVETVEALGKALNAFKGGVVIVSHDERLIEVVCKELWVVRDRTVTTLEGGLDEYKKQIYKLLAFTS